MAIPTRNFFVEVYEENQELELKDEHYISHAHKHEQKQEDSKQSKIKSRKKSKDIHY